MTAFVDALLGARRPVVMEIKVYDGAGVPLLAGRDVGELVAAYEKAEAPCLSVVTGRWFGGTPALLREVAQHTALPLLHKDFLTREAQLDRSRDSGASAVLLTAEVLPASVLATMVTGALDRGLTPFVEVTTHAQLTAVPRAAECVLAVSNKNIAQRELGGADVGRSHRLLPAVRATGTRCPVSASGLDDPRDAAALVRAGYAGVLVGSGLLRGDPDTWTSAFDTALRPAGVTERSHEKDLSREAVT